MFYIKKRRHKPLYKQFVRLRQNVQNRRILRIKKTAVPNRDYYDKALVIKFKKRKWQGFIKYLERILKYRKRNFRMYDLRLYHIQKFNNYFKKICQ